MRVYRHDLLLYIHDIACARRMPVRPQKLVGCPGLWRGRLRYKVILRNVTRYNAGLLVTAPTTMGNCSRESFYSLNNWRYDTHGHQIRQQLKYQ